MKTNDTRSTGGRHGRGGRRRPQYRDQRQPREPRGGAPQKVSFWRKILAFFGRGPEKPVTPPRFAEQRRQPEQRRSAPPERVEVTSPKLYVGNLNYDATEEDLVELFNGVGKVQNAEIVTHRESEKSKGFGFVTMLTVDEAIRAVNTLHDKPFMGRKLVVNGSKTGGSRDVR